MALPACCFGGAGGTVEEDVYLEQTTEKRVLRSNLSSTLCSAYFSDVPYKGVHLREISLAEITVYSKNNIAIFNNVTSDDIMGRWWSETRS
jgi:hypothetical protein